MEEQEKSKNKITVIEAAKRLGVSPVFVRLGLQDGVLPIGTAVKMPSGQFAYHISPGLLEEYINGKSLKNYFEEHKEFLKEILLN